MPFSDHFVDGSSCLVAPGKDKKECLHCLGISEFYIGFLLTMIGKMTRSLPIAQSMPINAVPYAVSPTNRELFYGRPYGPLADKDAACWTEHRPSNTPTHRVLCF